MINCSPRFEVKALSCTLQAVKLYRKAPVYWRRAFEPQTGCLIDYKVLVYIRWANCVVVYWITNSSAFWVKIRFKPLRATLSYNLSYNTKAKLNEAMITQKKGINSELKSNSWFVSFISQESRFIELQLTMVTIVLVLSALNHANLIT